MVPPDSACACLDKVLDGHASASELLQCLAECKVDVKERQRMLDKQRKQAEALKAKFFPHVV